MVQVTWRVLELFDTQSLQIPNQVGLALVKYYKIFLHVFNIFIHRIKSTGDKIDYSQRQVDVSLLAQVAIIVFGIKLSYSKYLQAVSFLLASDFCFLKAAAMRTHLIELSSRIDVENLSSSRFSAGASEE